MAGAVRGMTTERDVERAPSRGAAGRIRAVHARPSTVPWKRLKSGVEAMTLHRGAEGNSVLLRVAPGATLPAHRHGWLEEGVVLDGQFEGTCGEAVGPGDYHMSPAGAVHGRISSRLGGVVYVRGTAIGDRRATLRELAGGLLPFQERHAYTVSGAELRWSDRAAGAAHALLWSDGIAASRFVRLAAGAALDASAAESPVDIEVLAVSGEAFVGELSLRPAEFLLEPAGGRLDRLRSDVGAVLFVRGPLAWCSPAVP
jgi:ChrR Cupin-like domain